MMFALDVHKDQVRKYTGAPYSDHLAEVAGIVAGIADRWGTDGPVMLATSWLHDSIEDQGVSAQTLAAKFGREVLLGVTLLSDTESGNRAERKAAARTRLAGAPGWVQTIKVADLVSNTPGIVLHDPKFAVIYIEEKRLLLGALTQADPRLLNIARSSEGA